MQREGTCRQSVTSDLLQHGCTNAIERNPVEFLSKIIGVLSGNKVFRLSYQLPELVAEFYYITAT